MEDASTPPLAPMHFMEESKEEQAVRQCILQDIGQILAMFMGKRMMGFTSFRACWDQLDFSLVHAVKPDEISRAWFYDCLFDETIGTHMNILIN